MSVLAQMLHRCNKRQRSEKENTKNSWCAHHVRFPAQVHNRTYARCLRSSEEITSRLFKKCCTFVQLLLRHFVFTITKHEIYI